MLTRQSQNVKQRLQKSPAELTVGDKSTEGPSIPINTDTDILLCIQPHVTFEAPNESVVDLYIADLTEKIEKTIPFTHMVGLKGEKGIIMNIKGLFDNGTMVNLLCKSVYTSMQGGLGNLLPSSCTLHMANRSCVPLAGRWVGDVYLGTQMVKSSFEVFPSGGGWSLLFGKPLLKQFRAVHNYENDTICIPKDNRESETIANSTLKTPKYHTERHAQHNQGECKPPSRQVSSPDFTKSELVDKHCTANNTATSTNSNANLVGEHQPGKRRGRRSREKAEKNKRHAQQGSGFWEVVWTIGDSEAMGDGDMQPEVEVGGDKSLFTRQTNLFKPE